MANTINADNGVSSGSAGLKETADSSGVLALQTNGTTAVTVDTSQNVGIGTSSPAGKFHVSGGRSYFTANSEQFDIALKYNAGTSGVWLGSPGTDSFTVATEGGTERMRIDSSGNLLVATTAAPSGTVNGYAIGPSTTISGSTNNNYSMTLYRTGNDGTVALFYRAATNVGSISVTASATAYNTSSDYRLKNITGPVTNAKDFIMALKPKQGTWKVDGSKFVGFLAHEFQEVSPSSVVGDKDAVDADGKPIMQAMQASSSEVMANLVSFIQEQQALITALTTRIEALESK
jgi:hypothetical protein